MAGRKLNLTEEQRQKRREQMHAINARKGESSAAAAVPPPELDRPAGGDEATPAGSELDDDLGELFELDGDAW